MKKIYLLIALVLNGCLVFSQTSIPISNNMVIASNSNIKFIAGNYVFTDPEINGVIQITGAHDIVLDGDSCTVNGTNYAGCMIKITNSHNVVIKNFDSVFNYKYAVYISNSDHIIINGNDFSRNKVDSSGTINVWADYQNALGGGVLLYMCRAVQIFDNIMKYQNDGVAAYHSDSLKIHDNDFAWNTSFGIRLFWTDTCYIYNNLASHINRPKTDPSDCAAILLIISNKNKVEHNDFTYSGDGIFLGQYQYSYIQNNNYFAYNDCSYSPHNAIEATFADGNVYKHNICNYSPYGFWLGYSFNSIVDSNEVTGNYYSGIAIDRGFNNTITNNTIISNPNGIELWKGSSITGYENQDSKDYFITNNTIEGNEIGISAINTTHAVIENNDFNYNQSSATYLSSRAPVDTVTGNTFTLSTAFHIKNTSIDTVYAVNNSFIPSDSAMIADKIYDHADNTSYGPVNWSPYIPGQAPVTQNSPPCDMAEYPSVWFAYADAGYGGSRIPEVLSFDSTEKMVGAASLKLVTGRGFDVALNYRPAGDSVCDWTLTENDTLYFWVRTIKQPQYGFQYFSVRLGDRKGNYYRYAASPTLLNAANLTWIKYKIPLSGGLGFARTSTGSMSLSHVNYVEIHADTWDYGFTIWVDGVQFSPCDPLTGIPENDHPTGVILKNWPNPFGSQTTIHFELPFPDNINLEVLDMNGNIVANLFHAMTNAGIHDITFNASKLPGDIYFCRMITSNETILRKMLVIR